MTYNKEFQLELARYVIQEKEAIKYLKLLEADIFSEDALGLILGMIQDYVNKYRSQPSKAAALAKLEDVRKEHELEDSVYSQLKVTLTKCYRPLNTSHEHIKEVIVIYQKRKLTKQLFLDYSMRVSDAEPALIAEIASKMQRIEKIGAMLEEQDLNRGEFLIEDYVEGSYETVTAIPTYLHCLNRMTSHGGFYAPQLVIFLAAPKGFKTGFMINLAMGFVKAGFKVYYPDAENGQNRIRDRARQALIKSTVRQLSSGEDDALLTRAIKHVKAMKGEFRADFYPAHTKTMQDVDDELQYLEDEFGWKPDMICYDYLDLFKPIDTKIKDKRIMIQHVYFDAIRLQHKRQMVGFSLSQVNRGAVNKKVLDMTDFAEDFAKAANCHACFALCGTDAERNAGLMRIVPVVQRDGVRQGKDAGLLRVNEGKMSVVETTFEREQEVLAKLEIAEERNNKKSKVIKRRVFNKLKDE